MKAENQEIKKRKYEGAFILKVENAAIISQSLKNRGFAILTESSLEKVQLAYPIKKEDYAYFCYFHFEGDPAVIKNLRADIKSNPDILRYLIITPPFIKKNAARKPVPAESSEETKFAPSAGRQVLPGESILTNEALEKKIKELV